MKQTKRLLSLAVAIVLTLLPLCEAGAQAAAPSILRTTAAEQQAADTIDGFMERVGYRCTTGALIPLLGADGTVSAYYTAMRPNGYAVVDCLQGMVEFASEGSLELSGDEDIYYFGAGAFFRKEDDGFSHLFLDKFLTVEQAEEATLQFRQRCLSEQTARAAEMGADEPQAAVKSYNLPYATRRLSHSNPQYSGTVAAAITLLYYGDHVDSWVIPSWHNTESGQSLMDLISPQIEGTTRATKEDVACGLNYYFRWRGISRSYEAVTATAYSPTFLRHLQIIERPIILCMPNIDRVVVSTGFKYDAGFFACINEGLGKSYDVFYRFSECDGMVYVTYTYNNV